MIDSDHLHQDKAARSMSRWLRFGIAAYCLGTGIAALRYEPAVFSFMFTGLDWSSATTQLTVSVSCWILILIAPLMFLKRATPLCGLVALWVVVEIATHLVGRQRFHELAPLAMATRLLAPIALILIWRNCVSTGAWILRIGISATFIGHGLESIQENPIFVDYLLAATTRCGLDPTELAARQTLVAIGYIDICAAVLLLVRPTRITLYYLIAWGFITALARVVHSEWQGLDAFLLRTPHWASPLALWFYLYPTHGRSPQ